MSILTRKSCRGKSKDGKRQERLKYVMFLPSGDFAPLLPPNSFPTFP